MQNTTETAHSAVSIIWRQCISFLCVCVQPVYEIMYLTQIARNELKWSQHVKTLDKRKPHFQKYPSIEVICTNLFQQLFLISKEFIQITDFTENDFVWPCKETSNATWISQNYYNSVKTHCKWLSPYRSLHNWIFFLRLYE